MIQDNERWEHAFAYAVNGMVVSFEPTDPRRNVRTSGWELPVTIERYIFDMGKRDGFDFCGSYPKRDGIIVVMKRMRLDTEHLAIG